MYPFVKRMWDKFRLAKPPKADTSAPMYGQPGSDGYAFACAKRHVACLWQGNAVTMDDIMDFLIGAHAHCDARGDRDGVRMLETILNDPWRVEPRVFIRSVIHESLAWNFHGHQLAVPWSGQQLFDGQGADLIGPDWAFGVAMMTLFHTALLAASWHNPGYYAVDFNTATSGNRVDAAHIWHSFFFHDSYIAYGPQWVAREARAALPDSDMSIPFLGGMGRLETKHRGAIKYHAWSFSRSDDPLQHLLNMQIPYEPGRDSPSPMSPEKWSVLAQGYVRGEAIDRYHGSAMLDAVQHAVADQLPWRLSADYNGTWEVKQYNQPVPTWANPNP